MPKIGSLFLALFGVPFLLFGLFGVFAFLTASPTIHKNSNPVAGACFSLTFALIGAGLILIAIFGYRGLKQQAALKEASPDAPWLWQADWALSRAQSRNRNRVFAWWMGTVLLSMITVPIAVGTLPGLLATRDLKALIVVGFLALPLLLLVGALRSTARRIVYGKTYFEFNSLPFVPGRRLTGQIQLGSERAFRQPMNLRLSCVRRLVRGSGEEQSKNEIVYWQDEKKLPAHEVMVGPLGTSIPVDFPIPEDALETNHEQPSDQLLWVLHVEANAPGVDYADDYEVPIFRLSPQAAASNQVDSSRKWTNSEADARASFSTRSDSAAPGFFSDASDVPRPAKPKVKLSTTSEGATEFYFPAFRNKVPLLFLLAFIAIWTGIVFLLWRSNAPWFFAGIFAFFDLLLIYGCVQMAFVSTRITVGQGKVMACREILGNQSSWEVPFTDIETILPSIGMQQGTGPTNASYRIRIHTKSGRDLTVVDSIADRGEARWVVAEMEKLAGLKRDTHVAFEDTFGKSSGPPQRGYAGSQDVARGRGIQARAGRVLVFLMFFLWAGFMVRIFLLGSRHKASPPSSTGRNSSFYPGNAPRVVYATLSDGDIERLKALPPQAQAEELLERAIQHDARSLALFEDSIWTADWLGRIRLTDRMKELEQRSEISSDLRVRYANADLNLSMDGWAKTEQSANLLIERAASDPQYRPAAVYFMGMLAGRGVGYERIYPVLLQYAKHNPDVSVRLWSVEGMRYLGTDEALDQLFDSFIHDPSSQVRERAGANLSECGNFTRRQRMRLVPNLLSLVASPATDPQLRNWSFLALHQITDQNLPNQAATWRRWYEEHGRETLAQFEHQNWWLVRGDE